MNKTTMTHSPLKFLLPLIVLIALLSLAALALKNPPSVNFAPPDTGPRLTVEVRTLKPVDYRVVVPSYGTVQPRTQSNLVSQVSGEVTWVNAQFRDGGTFHAGDELLRIDPRDYEADLQIARASFYEAKQALAEEEAEGQQALADWQRLGNDGEPDPLVLRTPQLLAAQAAVASAEANLRKAQLNLERTSIKAPFDGRILSTDVDLGEVIGDSSQLATIYASDYVEIRLPLANADLDYVDLPEPGYTGGAAGQSMPVIIHSSLSRNTDWEGRLVRTEAAIDSDSHQLHAVAQVDDPFQLQVGDNQQRRKPLKIGEYVTASVKGRVLPQVIVIENSSLYQGSYVYVVEDGLLQRRDVEIAWQNGVESIIASGLHAGDQLVVTPLGQVTSGTRVTVAKKTTADTEVLNASTHSLEQQS